MGTLSIHGRDGCRYRLVLNYRPRFHRALSHGTRRIRITVSDEWRFTSKVKLGWTRDIDAPWHGTWSVPRHRRWVSHRLVDISFDLAGMV